jgi:hypothetical protein
LQKLKNQRQTISIKKYEPSIEAVHELHRLFNALIKSIQSKLLRRATAQVVFNQTTLTLRIAEQARTIKIEQTRPDQVEIELFLNHAITPVHKHDFKILKKNIVQIT